jgi:hypothetical protein
MTFKKNKYLIIRNFLDHNLVELLQDYFFIRSKSGSATRDDPQAPGSYAFYSDPMMETILDRSCKELSKKTKINLLPTYSYTRIYVKGNELKNHRDRPSCEISATLSLGFDGETNPIYFSKNEDKSDAVEILLNPGDLCLYRGCELWHWRPPFKNKWYLQSFLHYVDSDGPYKDRVYDEREFLAMPAPINRKNQI